MVEFNLCQRAGVPAIKILRMALGLGLKEAKDLHDSVRDAGGVKRVRATFAQYGAIDAYSFMDNRDNVWVSDVSVVTEFNGIDLTR